MPDGRLARARLADEAEHLARPEREGHVVDDVVAAADLDPQALDRRTAAAVSVDSWSRSAAIPRSMPRLRGRSASVQVGADRQQGDRERRARRRPTVGRTPSRFSLIMMPQSGFGGWHAEAEEVESRR